MKKEEVSTPLLPIRKIDFGDDFMQQARTLGTRAKELLKKRAAPDYAQQIAAYYLSVLDATGVAIRNGNMPLEQKLTQIFALCDAWHWFHMEVYGEHRNAFEGERTKRNLAKTGPKAEEKKRQRKKIIEEFCVEHWKLRPAHKTNALQTAIAIRGTSNAKLKSDGHTEYEKDSSLARVIREIMHKPH